MKIRVDLALAACGLGVACLAAASSDRWTVREEETIEKTIPLSGSPNRVIIDNLQGYVHATVSAGPNVHVKAHKMIRAQTDSDLTEAKRDVKLDISGKPGQVSVYYDAPWRCNGEGRACSGEHRHFYEVVYDIDVEVPRDAQAVVSTVNGGDIRLEGLNGNFDVRNVNGAIAMKAIGGTGDAHTVNGPIAIHFSKSNSPPADDRTPTGGRGSGRWLFTC